MSSLSQPNAKSSRRQSRRRPSHRSSLSRRLSRHTRLFELSARIGVNGIIAAVALTALGRLVPHIQTQAAQLEVVNQAVDGAVVSTSQLKSDFDRYFDPSQAEKIMQEQSGYRPPTERQVVWTEAAETEPSPEPSSVTSDQAPRPLPSTSP